MPYIEKAQRAKYIDLIGQLSNLLRHQPIGHVNYVVSKLLHESLPDQPHYGDLNTIIGVLECAKLELYRMVAAPYENMKRETNGRISDLDAKS